MKELAWPSTVSDLEHIQLHISALAQPPWRMVTEALRIGGCFVCFGRGGSGPGAAGDAGWAAAVEFAAGGVTAGATVTGEAPAPYLPGFLALREGPLLERAVRALPQLPDVLIVNATGRDHPRRCGLAVHLGAVLEVPSVGVTHRPLAGAGVWPADEREASSVLILEDEPVGRWVRTRLGARPLVAHAGWRTSPETAARVIIAGTGRHRTPEPIRRARELAREARARDGPAEARFGRG